MDRSVGKKAAGPSVPRLWLGAWRLARGAGPLVASGLLARAYYEGVRRLCIGVLAVTVGASACASLSGLSQYSSSSPSDDGAAFTPELEATTGDDAGDETATNDDVADPDAQSPEDAQIWDAAANDATAKDAGRDDSARGSDAATVPDAYVCGVTSCGGCCANGSCVGGQSVPTCGVGGVACKDCASMGACRSGSCAAPPVDAGPPPMCVVSQCTNTCAVAPIQGVCCKSDQTCGCQFTIFAPCL
jgi:hypothetical protein